MKDTAGHGGSGGLHRRDNERKRWVGSLVTRYPTLACVSPSPKQGFGVF